MDSVVQNGWLWGAALIIVIAGLLLLWARAGRIDADKHQDEYDEINHPRPAEPPPMPVSPDSSFENVRG
jgi:hypothetical protein